MDSIKVAREFASNIYFFLYFQSYNSTFLIGIDNYEHLLLNYEIIKNNNKLNDEEIEYINNKIKNINPLICNPVGWLFN